MSCHFYILVIYCQMSKSNEFKYNINGQDRKSLNLYHCSKDVMVLSLPENFMSEHLEFDKLEFLMNFFYY